MLRRSVLILALGLLQSFFVPLASAQTAIIDAAGRKVEIPAHIDRVLAAGPPASVLLYALAPEKMVGWVQEPSERQKQFLAAPYRDLPAHGRLTGRGNTANIEMVLSMKPDIILDVGTVDPTYASLADRVQQQTGIPYVLIDGSFANTAKTLRTVGEILGVKEKAEEQATFAEAALARLKSAMDTVQASDRPRVYYGRGPEGLETGLAGSINMEVLAAVGATNVAESVGSGGLANVSVEQVLSWNPDVILTLDPKFQAAVMTDPVWAGIKAVQQKRVYRAPNLPFGWFDTPPGINRLISAAWLATVLYPGRTDIDLKKEVRDFYALFYHVDLTDAQLATLLTDALPAPQ